MIADIIDDCSNFKVIIQKNFNPEYLDLAEKVIIHDNPLFGLKKIICTRTVGNFKCCGHIVSWYDGSNFSGWWFDKYLQNAPIQVYDIPNNMSYNYTYTLAYVNTYTLAYVNLDNIDMDTTHKTIFNILLMLASRRVHYNFYFFATIRAQGLFSF